MPVQLPKSIEAYFVAERGGGPDAVAAAFTEDAVIKDNGKTHVGHAAIRTWKAVSSQKYTYSMDPFSIATENGKTLVMSHVVGDFAGSPLAMRFVFVLAGDKIAEMEISV